MSDQPEPLDKIIAEMHDFCSGWSEDVDVTVKVGLIYGWKCRIEAAAERERALLDANIARVRELEDMMGGAADALLGAAVKQKSPGNAAAMRDALNRVGQLANDLRNITERDTEVRADVNEILDVCRAALAAQEGGDHA